MTENKPTPETPEEMAEKLYPDTGGLLTRAISSENRLAFLSGHAAATELMMKKQSEMTDVFKWLLGHYDFPEPPKDGRPRYYWRSHLQEKLKEIGVEISNDAYPFQPKEKGNLHD